MKGQEQRQHSKVKMANTKRFSEEGQNPSKEHDGQDKRERKKKTKKVEPEKRRFPWKTLIFFVFGASLGVFYVSETQKYGGFNESPVGKYLEKIGATHYARIAWTEAANYTRQGVEWSKENYPIYYAQLSTVLAPYAKLCGDLFQIVKYSAVRGYQRFYVFSLDAKVKACGWLDQNFPGVSDQSAKYYENVKEVTIHYGGQAFDYSKDKAFVAAAWARTNVFVGKLSPENLQRLTLEVVNTTQEYVKYGYQWISEQVNSAH